MKQRSALGWFTAPDVLAGVSVLAAAIWGAASVADGGSYVDLLPAVVTALLVAVALVIRRRSHLDSTTSVLPPWFVPAALGLAAVVGVFVGAAAAVATLVMASPAAAMFGVHAAFGTGASRARKAGVRLGGLATVEASTRVDTLILEKDGTLTTGELTVVSVDPHDPDHDRNLRWFAGALEKASDHRVGRAVATLAGRGRLAEVVVVPGCGIRGTVDRHPVRVGSPDWMGFEPAPTIWTTVGVEVDGRPLGTITVADDVRPELTRDVQRLTGLGLQLVLVSTDTPERTQHVARLADIASFHATKRPDDTGDLVRLLTRDGRRVATAGVAFPTEADLSITSDPSAAAPALVTDDCSPGRIADAIAAARGTASRVTRTRRATMSLAAIAAVVAAATAPGPVISATVGVTVFAASALLAVSR